MGAHPTVPVGTTDCPHSLATTRATTTMSCILRDEGCVQQDSMGLGPVQECEEQGEEQSSHCRTLLREGISSSFHICC